MVSIPQQPGFPPKVGVARVKPEQRDRAEKLALQLGLPMTAANEIYDFTLNCSDRGLELFRKNDPSLTGSIMVDFIQGASGYRRIRGGPEMLIRAIGHKGKRKTSILDATGGLGRDAFVMAAHGCDVHVIEKNPIVAALLEDGLRRAAKHPDTKEICSRIRLTIGDSCQLLRREKESSRYEVIYIDPMFPKRSKTARVKKELQALQLIVGGESNTGKLFTTALEKAGKRVVVKRPIKALPLPGRTPSHSLGGKTTRFDVYIV